MKNEIASKLNNEVMSVLQSNQLELFEKAFIVADATSKLKQMLTAEYMKPIMELQGNRLGFKTDKDRNGGYPMEVVKNCLIEAVLSGVQPYGNQFNIIAGNMYITKEGYGYLLKKIEGLSFQIKFDLPRISQDKKSAAIDAIINWTIKSQKNEEKISIPVKSDDYTTVDAIIGKATRKARHWLYTTITNIELPEGDITDTVIIKTTPLEKSNDEKEKERIIDFINKADHIDKLMQIEGEVPFELMAMYDQKKQVLIDKALSNES